MSQQPPSRGGRFHWLLARLKQREFGQILKAVGTRSRRKARNSVLSLRYLLNGRSLDGLPPELLHEMAQVGVARRRLPESLGMITDSEKAYFYWYAWRLFIGCGEIVDLGCWLGATTLSLAAGLAANAQPETATRKVHAYDRFVWEDWMDEITPVGGPPITRPFRPGESFLEDYQWRIAPWKDRVQVYPGDLQQLGWGGGPIEFLLIDAMKSWSLTNSILRDFFPALIPGRSVVVHQDFAFHGTPWIHLVSYRLRDYFRPLHHVPLSCSVAFELTKPIPTELLTTQYAYNSFTPEEVHAAVAYSTALVSKDMRANVLAVKPMIYLEQGDVAGARRVLEQYHARRVSFAGDLGTVAGLVAAAEEARHGQA